MNSIDLNTIHNFYSLSLNLLCSCIMDPRRVPKPFVPSSVFSPEMQRSVELCVASGALPAKPSAILGYKEAACVARTAIQQAWFKQYGSTDSSVVLNRILLSNINTNVGANTNTATLLELDTRSFSVVETVAFVRGGTLYHFEVDVDVDFEPQFQAISSSSSSSSSNVRSISRAATVKGQSFHDSLFKKTFSLMFSSAFAYVKRPEDPAFLGGEATVTDLEADGDRSLVLIEQSAENEDEAQIEVRVRDRDVYEVCDARAAISSL